MLFGAPDIVRNVFFYKARFSALYEAGKLLGQGSSGSVHAGTRKADGMKVALKFISKADDDEYLTFPGTSLRLPMEVALHMMVSRPPACDQVVELLEWFDQPDRVFLVKEHPVPCVDVNIAAFCTGTSKGIPTDRGPP
ncbi:hypothetical protein DPEC_G00089650 [Dallia pectoralis]|uniref:Uncharacterized protein n=1 Tax=Dallia pectoralis TaxID=75939 RepID=A0ACC2H0Q1_DALPE|nr:hypothetical protein DPEC_G00089650 [Dallia pectoralis]